MPTKDPNSEVADLRKQLDALKRQREAEAAERSNEPDTDEVSVEEQQQAAADDEILDMGDEISDDIVTQFKALMDNLDEELKTVRPSTLLIVFAMGVLIGRLR